MLNNITRMIMVVAIAVTLCAVARANEISTKPSAAKTETITFAGGCFWGVEAVFEHSKGVIDAISGYAGGNAETANYAAVSGGNTGHAEAVQVTYDPNKIRLEQLLDIYFTVAHNPTQLNFQGPDHGTQYRSAVFYSTPEQRKKVEQKIAMLDSSEPIVTTLEPLETFYQAEEYHQNYAAHNPYQPYILMHDAPKVAQLKKLFPELYK